MANDITDIVSAAASKAVSGNASAPSVRRPVTPVQRRDSPLALYALRGRRVGETDLTRAKTALLGGRGGGMSPTLKGVFVSVETYDTIHRLARSLNKKLGEVVSIAVEQMAARASGK